LYDRNADILPEWVYENFDYGDYPIEEYWGGYFGVKHAWLRERCAEIYKRWGEEIDCVMFAIASDNWKLDDPSIVKDKPVWGWNISAQYSTYGVQQVRIAQVKTHTTERNINNSVGTVYHELMHDHDTFTFVNTGKTVEPVVGVPQWDNSVVHGEHPNWQYIRHKENQKALEMIAPLLRDALTKRRELLTMKLGLMRRVIELLQQLRALLAAQRGDIAILPNNQCNHVTKNF
jgi:hypothetical protein